MTRVEKLLSISSGPLSDGPPADRCLLAEYPLGAELLAMLERNNLESALHVFPLTVAPVNGANLFDWNSESLRRSDYADWTAGLLFFAEDVFQDQFCFGQSGVLRFNAETGGTKSMARSLEEWADLILRDYPVETGWGLAKAWQTEHGAFMPGQRLMPKTPFTLGGDYSLGNLRAGDAVEGMRFKADVAMQIRNVPDGGHVRLVIGKKPVN